MSVWVADYFCGAGGFTRGALDAGAYVALAVDRDQVVEETYVHNNVNKNGRAPELILKDVHELCPSEVTKVLKSHRSANGLPRPLLFIGCPPCQPFTNLKTDKKKSLPDRDAIQGFLNHVESVRPDYVVIENVPGIRLPKFGSVWEDSIKRLKQMGFKGIREMIVNAKHYGVPQSRRRVLLLASRKAPAPLPIPTHDKHNFVTVEDTIRHLAPLESGERHESDPMHTASHLSALNLERIQAIKEPGGDRRCWPPRLQLECFKGRSGHTDVYGRLDWKSPAPTITTRFVSLSNGRFGHPEQDRALTPREGALLQTFPDDFDFKTKSRGDTSRLIGNAVPPKLARAVTLAIIQHFESTTRTDE